MRFDEGQVYLGAEEKELLDALLRKAQTIGKRKAIREDDFWALLDAARELLECVDNHRDVTDVE